MALDPELAAAQDMGYRPPCELGACGHPMADDGQVEVLVIVGGVEHSVFVNLCASHVAFCREQSLVGLTL